jgi:hypothetical protein
VLGAADEQHLGPLRTLAQDRRHRGALVVADAAIVGTGHEPCGIGLCR